MPLPTPVLPPSQGYPIGTYPTAGTWGYPTTPVAPASAGQITPAVTSLSKTSAKVGDPAFDIIVTGERFTASSRVTVAGTAVPTSIIDDRHLTATINPVGATAGAKPVLVDNGGAVAPTPQTFTFTP